MVSLVVGVNLAPVIDRPHAVLPFIRRFAGNLCQMLVPRQWRGKRVAFRVSNLEESNSLGSLPKCHFCHPSSICSYSWPGMLPQPLCPRIPAKFVNQMQDTWVDRWAAGWPRAAAGSGSTAGQWCDGLTCGIVCWRMGIFVDGHQVGVGTFGDGPHAALLVEAGLPLPMVDSSADSNKDGRRRSAAARCGCRSEVEGTARRRRTTCSGLVSEQSADRISGRRWTVWTISWPSDADQR
jgi:hypothetical protein